MTESGNAVLAIRAGDARATIDPLGATLIGFYAASVNLLSGPPTADPARGHHGAVLAPWPNRVGGGRYQFDGLEHRLPLNDTRYGHALHGLAFGRIWTIVARERHLVRLGTEIEPATGYPFDIRLEVEYALEEDLLRCSAAWQNAGDTPAPFGIGFHPYLRPGGSGMDDWILDLPARAVLESDDITRLPLAARPADPAIDFSPRRPIGAAALNRTYELLPGPDGDFRVGLADPAGVELEFRLSPEYRWLHVYTGDRLDPTHRRQGIALEPQTCPPNAFVSGTDLIRLAPMDQGSAEWMLRITSPAA